MRLLRSAIATGLLVISLDMLVVAAATEAAAASDCPCIKTGNSCIPDLACEARERERERFQRQERELIPRAQQDRELIQRAQPQPDQFRSGHEQKTFELRRPSPSFEGAPPSTLPPPAALPAPPPPAARAGARPPPGSGSNSGIAADTRVNPGPPPLAAPGQAAAPGAPGPQRPASATARLRILETGYSHLTELGKEADGYGLYSYAILPFDSIRAALFLGQVFKEIPSIGDTSAQPSQLNIFYVPLRADKEADFAAMLQAPGRDADKIGAEYTKSFYDYRMARALLDHVCNPPDPSVLDLCNGDLSRGPYIFTYASPASRMEPVPPPFLFVDLSDVRERAFGEFLAAFQAQVKRGDISDQARIRTLRLRILDIALTAADWVGPVQKAIADIARSASGGDDKK